MVMRILCAGFVWTTIKARLNKDICTSARFHAYVTEKSPTKMSCIFLTGVRTHLTPLVWLRHCTGIGNYVVMGNDMT